MPLPKLSPLQSRLAASLIASFMLLMLYLALASPHFAYAADADSIGYEDHNHERLFDTTFEVTISDSLDVKEYVPEFLGLDRGIVGRQANAGDPLPLVNNVKTVTNVIQGALMSYVFPNASLYGARNPVSQKLPTPLTLVTRDFDMDSGMDGTAEDDDDEEAKEELRLKPRQTGAAQNRTLYITVAACDQPKPIQDTTRTPPPQLKLYVSTSENNTKPGPEENPATQEVVTLQGGYGMYALNATGDVFVGVYGENTTDYEEVWQAQITASIDAPFQDYYNNTDPNLFLVDGDSTSALLSTDNLLPMIFNTTANSTLFDEWMNLSPPPFSIYASETTDRTIMGLQRSHCAWDRFAQMGNLRPGNTVASTIETSMTSRGVQRLPKQQFYMGSLKAGTRYNAVLALASNDTDGAVGGGGAIFPMTDFATLSDGNCGLIFNLSFCTDSAYAAPSNPNNFPNMTSLAAFYDNYTQSYYENFQKVLSLTPCDTTSSAKYSLVRGCADCEIAYKRWLCSIAIPRCTDFSSTDKPWVVPRAMGQSFPNGTFLPADLLETANGSPSKRNSRNPIIDEQVAPGPYKEVLPCDDLCYNVVQSCPASMRFQCPSPGQIGFDQSYGIRPEGVPGELRKVTDITCNYPGAAYYLAAGQRERPARGLLLGMLVGVIGVMIQ